MSKLRFTLIRRPGIYHTNNTVSAFENIATYDELPELHEGFIACMNSFQKKYFEEYKFKYNIIEHDQLTEYFTNKDNNIVLNHVHPWNYASSNLHKLYIPIESRLWDVNDNMNMTQLFRKNNVLTVKDVQQRNNDKNYIDINPTEWKELNEVPNFENKKLQEFLYENSQYISYLLNTRNNNRMILFHSNHLSLPLSYKLGKLVKLWKPDSLCLEFDSLRLKKFIKISNNIQPFFDMGVALSKMSDLNLKQNKRNIVLCDWNKAQYNIMDKVSKYLDSIQSSDAVDTSWGISLNIIGQLFIPQYMPELNTDTLNEHYEYTLRFNQPHSQYLFDKRNDMFAYCLHHINLNDNDKKILGVFGSSHMPFIKNRLIKPDKYKFMSPFQMSGSHNVTLN